MSKYLVTYSAIVDGQGNPFGSPEDHEREVERLLATLLASNTGRAVFRKIVAHGVVRILPYSPSRHAKYGRCNALAFGEHNSVKVASGLSRPSVNVEFSAGTWVLGNGCIFGPGARQDEILLHELVHSMRALGGERDPKPLTGKMAHFKNEEEYYAVLLANIYISEMGRQPASWLVGSGKQGLLRLSYTGVMMPDEHALSVDFLLYGDNFRLVKKFCEQHPNIARLIGEVSARYNPIKVFLRWKKLGIEPRNGALARSR